MSGGTPTQNAVLLTLVGVVAAGVVLVVVLGRLRRRRAAGSAEPGSVRSRAQAKEIAERLYSYCSGPDGSPGEVRVRGAARLLSVLKGDDRFEVTARRAGEEYWSFSVSGPGAPNEELRRGVVDVLARNGVTASASRDVA